jgi:hypothetical protein
MKKILILILCVGFQYVAAQNTPPASGDGSIDSGGEINDPEYSNDCPSFCPKPGEQYIISAWVKEDVIGQPITYINSKVEVSFSNAVQQFIPQGYIIEGWQRIAGVFTVPNEGYEQIEIRLWASNENVNVYFDDVRVYPYNGSLKSFVYDENTQRLMAELDENNYATYYEYDNEGGLIRVKKETEKGIYTIQETRSSSVINNN